MNPTERVRPADIYYRGNDYCCEVLPAPGQALELVRQDASENRRVVWVTPFVKEKSFQKIIQLLGLLGEQPCVKEIAINDVGVLAWSRSRWPSKKFTIGRLLSPFFIHLPSKWLQDAGVDRIEVDDYDVLVGSKPCVPVSFHVPYRHMTISDTCPMCENNRGTCNRECVRAAYTIEESTGNSTLLMVGRTLLEMSQVPLIDWREYNVDRIVWHPTCLS